ncbi:MAG: hypothetical protein WD426_18085 [Anditalea sp.]
MMGIGYACMQWPDRNQADRRETAGPVRENGMQAYPREGKSVWVLAGTDKRQTFSQGEISQWLSI